MHPQNSIVSLFALVYEETWEKQYTESSMLPQNSTHPQDYVVS